MCGITERVSMIMKKIIIYLLCFVTVLANELPLSKQKIELLALEREQILEDLNKNKNSWIAPLIFTGSLSESKDTSNNISQTKNASLNWNQDIFRSGGIFYMIDQANAVSQFNLYGVDLKEANYLKNIYILKTKINRDKLLQKQNELIFKNREIDLFIITQKYKAGSADISVLNRANIDKDNARTQMIVVKNNLANEKFELKKLIGDKYIDDIILANFDLISKKNYLKNNLELLQYDAKNKSEKYNTKVTLSSFYPKLTFISSYGYTDYGNDNNYVSDYAGHNYRYGLTFSMPLDINKKPTVESSKLQYLQSKISANERKLELIQEYDKHYQNISDFNEKVLVAKNASIMYCGLYDFTYGQVKAGFKSSYELESLANSVEIQKLEIEIQNYNILIEKITLYFDIKH